MKRKDLERALRALGWSLVRHGRRHDVWGRETERVTVPRHDEIAENTARGILKEAKGG